MWGDLYRLTPGALSAAQRRDAISASATAALMLIGPRTDPCPDGGGDGATSWLDQSFSGRAEVHQATGVVIAQLGRQCPSGAGAAARSCPSSSND